MSNVNAGDLAMVTSQPNYGALCRVIDRVESAPLVWACEALQSMSLLRIKRSEPMRERVPAGSLFRAFDTSLKRIEPGDAPDETLAWVGKPKQHDTTPAPIA